MRPRIVVLAAALVAAAASVQSQSAAPASHWVGTWGTALVVRPIATAAGAAAQAPPLNFNNQTLRQIVHVSVGGPQLRAVFSNVFGTAPLTIGAAAIGIRDKSAAIVAGSSRRLTFSGQSTAAIAPGAVLVSDPVTLTVPDLADLAVDLYLPGDTSASMSPLSHHTGNGALQTSYVSSPGDHTGAADLPVAATTLNYYFVSRVDVLVPEQVGAVVAFGDSITDGSHSTPDTNNRWPNHLARHLLASGVRMGVINEGIGGNRLLSDGNSQSALARFDRDVLAQAGATSVIILEGINDLGARPQRATVDDLIAGHRQLIARAHARGLRAYGVTITPFAGTTIAPEYWSPEGEAARQAFNRWLRTSGEYDGVIDFEAVLRDPAEPTKVAPKFSSPDHLHPNDAGYEALGNAVDVALFRRPAAGTRGSK
jgi:lysophospholipase L1-like esterase